MEWGKQKETKQQPGTAKPGNILGCCFVSLRFLCNIHSIHSVLHKLIRPFCPASIIVTISDERCTECCPCSLGRDHYKFCGNTERGSAATTHAGYVCLLARKEGWKEGRVRSYLIGERTPKGHRLLPFAIGATMTNGAESALPHKLHYPRSDQRSERLSKLR